MVGCCLLAWAVLAWCGGLPAQAQEHSGRGRGSAKDPVETAFELPQGTRLTSAQAKALNKMRREYEPQLRGALDKMNSETDAKAKRTDAKEALRVRQTIRSEIDSILDSSAPAEASPGTVAVPYESRYPTSAGTGEVPYYTPYAYPAYPYPYVPVVVYPYYPRPHYYYDPKYHYDSKYHPANNSSQSKTTATTRPVTPSSNSRPAYSTSRTTTSK
jgi:hypothetical protein